MKVQKCDFPNCTKLGNCRAPKDRKLNEYYMFCSKHAAEYNKNWNYYSGMSESEINADWERQTFGPHPFESFHDDHHLDFLRAYLSDSRAGTKKILSPNAAQNRALKTLELNWPTTMVDIQKQYRKLAKKYHPDTSASANSQKIFQEIAAAYDTLSKWLKPVK